MLAVVLYWHNFHNFLMNLRVGEESKETSYATTFPAKSLALLLHIFNDFLVLSEMEPQQICYHVQSFPGFSFREHLGFFKQYFLLFILRTITMQNISAYFRIRSH